MTPSPTDLDSLVRGKKWNSRRTDPSCTSGGDPDAALPKQLPTKATGFCSWQPDSMADLPNSPWAFVLHTRPSGSGAYLPLQTPLPLLYPSRKGQQEKDCG